MGAWIETFGINDSNVYTPVAPYMGAWIETFRKKKNFVNKQSHPTWVRGLKLIVRAGAPSAEQVAPYMGAWIETEVFLQYLYLHKSHPTWVRGLKRYCCRTPISFTRSHPTWVRGLKLYP